MVLMFSMVLALTGLIAKPDKASLCVRHPSECSFTLSRPEQSFSFIFLPEMGSLMHRQVWYLPRSKGGWAAAGQWGLDVCSPHCRLNCLVAKQLHVSKVTKAKIKWQGRPELREQLGRCGSLQSVSLLFLSAAGSGVCVLF